MLGQRGQALLLRLDGCIGLLHASGELLLMGGQVVGADAGAFQLGAQAGQALALVLVLAVEDLHRCRGAGDVVLVAPHLALGLAVVGF
ncbi:hypothetical protein D9M69_541260 [compost metagenome]